MVTEPTTPAADETGSPHLQENAIGFMDALVIGLASTSPAYSLAAVIGPIVVLAGVSTPGVLLASFVPMLLIASAFYYFNRVDQDCGTTFSWVTRAMGPWLGWLGGWAITMTGVLVIGSLADVAFRFGLLTFGLDGLASSKTAVMIGAVVIIVLMTWLCVLGTELSAHVQNGLIIAQVLSLLLFAVVAISAVVRNTATPEQLTPELSWLNPFGAGGAALTGGLLLGVFAYWGWESAVNLTEETENSATAPGKAALLSTVVLLATYLSVAIAIVAYFGTEFLSDNAADEEFIFALLAKSVLGPFDWIVLLAVATSAIASTQTTILPASRTALSMARRTALPARFGHIHRQHRTPDVSTWWVAVIAIAWYVVVNLISENALFDSLTALSLLIASYYGLTGIACAIYFRRQLRASMRNLLLIGVGPVIGALLLLWLLVESVVDMADPANSYSGQSWLGVGPPLVIGVAIFVAGLVLMAVWRTRDTAFWSERPGLADPLPVD